MLGYYGYPTTGLGYGAYALPFAAGDYDPMRDLARASAQRLEQLKPPNAQRELRPEPMLWAAYRTQAEASYRLKDYAAADRRNQAGARDRVQDSEAHAAGEARRAAEQMLAAMIAARLGKQAEAQKIIEPVLKFHRELYARGRDNEDLVSVSNSRRRSTSPRSPDPGEGGAADGGRRHPRRSAARDARA